MAELSSVYDTSPKHTVPLSSILSGAMDAMTRGGHVKISNHTGRKYPHVAYQSAYAVLNQAIPKFYIYVKSPNYNLWQEYDGVMPMDRCIPESGMSTLATESNVFQRMNTRMNNPLAFRIMTFDAHNKLLMAFDRQQINLLG